MTRKFTGLFYSSQTCPYCNAKLLKDNDYLVCRYHKWAFPIIHDRVIDYRLSSVVKNYYENK